MKEILEKDNLKILRVGEIVKGRVIGKEKGALFLDLGPSGTGIIYGKEFDESRDVLKNLKTGDGVSAKVIDLEDEQGYIELSISQAGKELSWEELKEKKERKEIITVKILGANKGGLLTEISGIQGFLPVSQLSPNHYPKVEGGETNKILRELQKFIGKDFQVQVFDLDPNKEKLILSEKAKEGEKIKDFLKNCKAGDIVEGEITGILDFGAFIRFPLSEKEGEKDLKLEGLIHISELDWKIVEDPSEVVEVGQRVRAKIVEISNDKVSLSLKAFKKDPWENIEKKYKKGGEVKGKVTRLNPFGAFIQITPTIQGLCHISEFGSQKRMEEVLKIGQKYNFKILLIEPKEHRMILKLSQ